jgi:hypothetical protein
MGGFFESPEYRKYRKGITHMIDVRAHRRLTLTRAEFTSAEEYVSASECLGAEIQALLYVRDHLPNDLTIEGNTGHVDTENQEEATYGGETELVGCEEKAEATPEVG